MSFFKFKVGTSNKIYLGKTAFNFRAGTLDNLGNRITLGKFNLGNPKLDSELKLLTKCNLENVLSSPKLTNFK